MTEAVGDGRLEALVPRTSAARSPRELADAVARRRGRSTGWWGMLMLVASEATLFGCLLGTYFYLRSLAPQWPPSGAPLPPVVVPFVLAGVLTLTVAPVRLALGAARSARLAAVRALLVLALLVQSGYFAYAVHDFQDRLSSLTPQDNAYGSITYLLLGATLAHVAVGLLLDLWLLLKVARGLTAYRLNALEAISLYWYAVVVLTLLVTATVASARL
jgi:cytochrome c oxidase subunit III